MQSTLFEKMTTCLSMRATHAKWNVILYLLSIRVGVWGLGFGFHLCKKRTTSGQMGMPREIAKGKGMATCRGQRARIGSPYSHPIVRRPPASIL